MVNRRQFLTKELFNFIKDAYDAFNEESATDREKEEENNQEYFRSFEKCYPFLAEVSLEELQCDAKTRGIDSSGKDKYELARLIFNCDNEKEVEHKN
ncbi:MAG: hypothetical protein CVU87_10665 [Firmicutes bacterium HGW-Firmicutes-12]|jgi:hypothetical protein|nr:MAG: hypothetical protein CVU87_10665 [Firmicutes bacterium HGW-Firmicutes-12]